MHLIKTSVLICGLLGLGIIIIFPLRIVEPGISYLLFSELTVTLALVPRHLITAASESDAFPISQRRYAAILLFFGWGSMVLAVLNVLSVAPVSLLLQGVLSGMGIVLYLTLMFGLLQIGGFGSALGESGFQAGIGRRVSHNTVFTALLLCGGAPIAMALVLVSANTGFLGAKPIEIALICTALVSVLFGLTLYCPARMVLPRSRVPVVVLLLVLVVFLSVGLEISSRNNWILFACSLASFLGLSVGVLRIARESLEK